MADPAKHKWAFPVCFRKNAYGWRSSRLAVQHVKELDVDEDIETVVFPITKIESILAEKKFLDSKTIIGLREALIHLANR